MPTRLHSRRQTDRRRAPRTLGFLAATGIACAIGLGALGTAASRERPAPAPLDDQARMGITADYLGRAQLPSGLFPYDYDFATGLAEDMSDVSGLNIVRQALAVFGLVQYLQLHDSRQVRETVARALQAFAERSLPIGKGRVQSLLEHAGAYNRWRLWNVLRAPLDSAGLLYVPGGQGALVSGNGSYERAWPGATALALVSELWYRRLTNDARFAPASERWAHGLVAMHVPDRGLREAPHYLSESPYVNGEAWLALVEYSLAFPNDHSVARTLSELEEYLIRRYRGAPSLHFYHWGAMAAARRWETTREPRLFGFIREQADWYLQQVAPRTGEPGNSCVAVEGLSTAYRVLRTELDEQDPLMVKLRTQIERSMTHNRALQIQPGQESFKLATGVEVHSPLFALNAGAFMASSAQARVQIDWAGHCLSALARLQRAGLAR